MNKILYIDMDGVVADFDKLLQTLVDVELGEGDPSTYEQRSRAVDEAVKQFPTLFEHLEFIHGAKESVNKLKDSYEIYFLSTPMCAIPESYMGKRVWIRDKFGDWADRRLILTHRKDLCIGDYLIDDRKKNGAENFRGEHIHFGTEKFPNWDSVLKYLL